MLTKQTVTAYSHSTGLGDTIAKMTKAVGVKPCGGCKKRQEILNKAVPYRRQVKVEAKQRLKDLT